MLWRACMHVCVVNSCALRMAGWDVWASPEIVGGSLDKAPNGELTGVARENAAMELYRLSCAHNSHATRRAHVEAGLRSFDRLQTPRGTRQHRSAVDGSFAVGGDLGL